MKLVALCIKTPIPVIYHKHPFAHLLTTNKFFNERQTRSHVKNLAETKLLPFLESIENIHAQLGDSFRINLSVSGKSVKLLKSYAPQVIGKIKSLSESGVAEFLAQPWSDSILNWFIQDELKRQTNLHRNTIKATFGKLPRVFMADLPLNSSNFKNFNPYPECRLSLTCSNHLRNIPADEATSTEKRSQFVIHHSLSHKFQQLASNHHELTGSKPIAPFLRYLRKHASLVRPLILNFNPLSNNISSFKNFEHIIQLLHNRANSSFYSLTDLEETSTYFSIDNNYSKDLLEQFEAPDYWLKNKMQQEAFSQIKTIYKKIRTTHNSYLPEAWEYIQDLNNFMYMSDSFFSDEFASQVFSPFQSPHEAFTSYMNAVTNFWTESTIQPKSSIKKSFFISPANN